MALAPNAGSRMPTLLQFRLEVLASNSNNVAPLRPVATEDRGKVRQARRSAGDRKVEGSNPVPDQNQFL